MKWLAIGLGLLVVAGVFQHWMKRAHWQQWVDPDA